MANPDLSPPCQPGPEWRVQVIFNDTLPPSYLYEHELTYQARIAETLRQASIDPAKRRP